MNESSTHSTSGLNR